MKKFLCSLIIVCISCTALVAQDFSNKGKDFWLCFPQHVPTGTNTLATLSIFITSDVASSGTVSMPNGAFSATFNIAANGLQEIQIPWSAAIHMTNSESSNENVTNVLNKAIRITTDAGSPAVVAYAQQWAGARSAATLLLPVNVLGKKYFVYSFTASGGNSAGFNSRSQFQIIATKANTVVRITPRKNGVTQASFTVTFPQAGNIIQYQSPDGAAASQDLTGTLIESIPSGTGECLPIAVYSGNSNVTIGAGGCSSTSGDPLWQQLYPTSTWGKSFGFVPFADYPSGNPYRVMASEDNTVVNFNGTQVAILNAGEIYPAGFVTSPVVLTAPTSITADKPISVAQYAQSQACAGNNIGDPDMVILNPLEQNISDITIFSSSRQAITKNWINVLLKTAAVPSFRINNVAPGTAWQTFPTLPGYSYLRHQLAGTGSFKLNADSGFNAIAYGFGNFESYAYSAGTNVKDLFQTVGIGTEFGIETTPTVCVGTPFRFKVSLPYQPDSIKWNFFNAANPPGPNIQNVTQNNPVVDSTTIVDGRTIYWYSINQFYTFNNVGSYPIRITTFSPASAGGCGTVQDIDFTLEVSATPVVNFANTNPRCVAETVQFTDATVSARPTYIWYWDFGDPGSGGSNSSSIKNPSHVFSAPGTYNVRFSSITTAGCIGDTITKQIVIAALPTAAATASAPTVCQNAAQPTITFTGSGGSVPYTFTYNINGGATQTITTVGAANTAVLNVPTAVVGSFTYNVTQVQNTGSALCVTGPISTVSATIVVNPFPSATIAGGATVCQQSTGNVVTFTGSNGVLPYTFTYNINGGAPLTVSTTGGSSSATVAVPSAAVGTFTYNLVSVSEGTPSGCVNTFAPAPSTTFVVNGLPTATIAGTASLCINAVPAPVITFTGANGTSPYIFTYTINGGAAQTVNSPAGNNTATVTAPTGAAGTFTYALVSVRESSSTNCSQAQTGNAVITIFPAPVAAFTASNPSCATRTIDFNSSTSTAGAGTITSYAWDFGDPASGAANTSALPNPSHIYTTTGSYTVSLTITTSNGCTNTRTQAVVVNPRPQAGFILPEVCLLDPFAQFTDTSSVAAPGTITGWLWNFGDPASGPLNTSTVQNATHRYNAVGNYNVELIVTTNTGCKDTLSNQVLTINSGDPMSNFVQTSPSTNCANDSVGIQNRSTITSGSITRLEIYWDNVGQPAVFDFDEFPTFNKIYNHKYPDFQSPLVRTFQVRVRAFSGGVCFSDRVVAVNVNASPRVQFTPIPPACYTATPYQITQATEVGGVPGSGVFSGPGITAAGIFSPTLVPIGVPQTIKFVYTSTAGGCKDSATQTITVLDTATARFTVTPPSCQGNPSSFTDNSTAAAGGTLTNTVWNFGDGTPPENHTPGSTFTHTFINTGTFTVTMYNVSADGCRSTTTSQPVIVSPKPRPNFVTDKADYCLPDAVVMFNSSSSTIIDGTQASFTYLWDFGDPASGAANTSTLANPSHTYTTLASYNVKLTITSGAGCSFDTTIVFNKLHPKPVADFSSSTANVCIGQGVNFLDRSNGRDGTLQSWTWLYGDGVGASSAQNPPTYFYTKVGVYNVKLSVVNSFGCTADTTKVFTVFQFPTVDAGPTLYVLEGGSTTITPTINGNGLAYLWSWNVPAANGYLDNPTLKNPFTTPLTNVLYTLTVSAQGQCSASDTVSVIVLKDPRIPNTFSPNNDGINDVWTIRYLDTYPNAKVRVFTRTGALVFSSKGYPRPWDGNVNGKSVPVDTYYYIIEPENGRPPITGYVTVVK